MVDSEKVNYMRLVVPGFVFWTAAPIEGKDS